MHQLLNPHAVTCPEKERVYQLTPYIITLCEGDISTIDLTNFIEMGLRILRFRMSHLTMSDRIKLLKMIKRSIQYVCNKHDVVMWPIAISVDISNACIRTGLLDKELHTTSIYIEKDQLVEITSDVKYWDKCNSKKIFIDDPYTIKSIKVNTEITIDHGEIVLFCTKVIDDSAIGCKVHSGGYLKSTLTVCVRGIKHARPPFLNNDMNDIHFAQKHKVDIVTMNYIRYPSSVIRIREIWKGTKCPLILSAICEQEGLDNIDEIIKLSDGIILAREFLFHEIVDKYKMPAIQLEIGAKCKRAGKPFYISGNILDETMSQGSVSESDVSDVTNAVLQGAGLVFRHYTNTNNVVTAMKVMSSICQSVENVFQYEKWDFWRIIEEMRMPVNAAEACILSTVLAAKCLDITVIIIPTVTGKTARQLHMMLPRAVVVTVSCSEKVARRLQIFRGIIPLIYKRNPKDDWKEDKRARIRLAISFCLKNGLLGLDSSYITLQKSCAISAYHDQVEFFRVQDQQELAHLYSRKECTEELFLESQSEKKKIMKPHETRVMVKKVV